MTPGGDNVLRLEGLTKRFGGLVAVNNVSFDVQRRSIAAIIGPNGAGKTTLFHLMSGFLRPDQGRVYLEGRNVTRLRPDQIAAHGLMRTFQLVRLFARSTVLDNVLVGRHLRTKGGIAAAILRPRWYSEQEQESVRRAHELLALVGLQQQAHVPAGTLTYGQQRLLEIARALAGEPTLLMLDEPAAGLNAEETRKLSHLIARIRDFGITVLFVEHDMTLVMTVAETVHVLDFGNRIAGGSPAEVQADPAVISAYLGIKADAAEPVLAGN